MISVDERRMDNVGCSNASEYFLDNISRVYEKLVATRMTIPRSYSWASIDDMPKPKFQNWVSAIKDVYPAGKQFGSLFAKSYLSEGCYGTETMPLDRANVVDKVVPSKLNRQWFEDAYNVIFNFVETPRVSNGGWVIHSPEIVGCTTMRDMLSREYTITPSGCYADDLVWNESAQDLWTDFLEKMSNQSFTLPGLPASLCGAKLGNRSFFEYDGWAEVGCERRSLRSDFDDWYNYDCIEPINHIYGWLCGASESELYPSFASYCKDRAPGKNMRCTVVDLGCGSENGIRGDRDTMMLHGGCCAQAALCRASRDGCGILYHGADSVAYDSLAAEVPTMRLVSPSVYRMMKLSSIAAFGGYDRDVGEDLKDHIANVTVSTDELYVRFPHIKRTWMIEVAYSYSMHRIDDQGYEEPGNFRYDIYQEPRYHGYSPWEGYSVGADNEVRCRVSKTDNLNPAENPFKFMSNYHLAFGDLLGVSEWDGRCTVMIRDPDTLETEEEKNVARGLMQLFTDSPTGCFEYVGCLLRGDIEPVSNVSGSGESSSKVEAIVPPVWAFSRDCIVSPTDDMPATPMTAEDDVIDGYPRLFFVAKRHTSFGGKESDEYAAAMTNGFIDFLDCVLDIYSSVVGGAVGPLEKEGYDRFNPDTIFSGLPSEGDLASFRINQSGCVFFSESISISEIRDSQLPHPGNPVYVQVIGRDPQPRPVILYEIEFSTNVGLNFLTNWDLARNFNMLIDTSGVIERGISVENIGKLGALPEVHVRNYPSTRVVLCPSAYGSYRKYVK